MSAATRLTDLYPDPVDRSFKTTPVHTPIIDTFPSIVQDSIFLDTLLKEMGMHYVTSGWGNWELGPRIISMMLALDACSCHVHKAYFYDQMRSDSTWDLRVTERVECNVPDSLIPWWTDQ